MGPNIINDQLTWSQIQQVHQYPFPKAKIYVENMNQYFNVSVPFAVQTAQYLKEKDFAICLQVEKPVDWWLALSSPFSNNPPRLYLNCDELHSEQLLTATYQNFYIGALLGSGFAGICVSI